MGGAGDVVPGGNVSVIFVPATPQSALRYKYEEEIRKVSLNIKVVERSGVTIKNQMQRSNPFGGKRCQRDARTSKWCAEVRGKGSVTVLVSHMSLYAKSAKTDILERHLGAHTVEEMNISR